MCDFWPGCVEYLTNCILQLPLAPSPPLPLYTIYLTVEIGMAKSWDSIMFSVGHSASLRIRGAVREVGFWGISIRNWQLDGIGGVVCWELVFSGVCTGGGRLNVTLVQLYLSLRQAARSLGEQCHAER